MRLYRAGTPSYVQPHQWTVKHRDWITRQRLDDPLAHAALEQILVHRESIERQLRTLDATLEQITRSQRWSWQVHVLTRSRGIATLCALGLIAEIGDFAGVTPGGPSNLSMRSRLAPIVRGSSRPWTLYCGPVGVQEVAGLWAGSV